jgi:hypothetical protein
MMMTMMMMMMTMMMTMMVVVVTMMMIIAILFSFSIFCGASTWFQCISELSIQRAII